MTDTLTDTEMIQALEADGCTITTKERDTSAPWAMCEITARWTVDDDIGMYHITEQAYGELPIAHLYRNVRAIREMQAHGYVVLMDHTPARFRVRVQKRGQGRFLHNQATTSTSGYPIQDAFVKWHQHWVQEGGAQ